MKFEHIYSILKICEQQRFHLVALRNLLFAVDIQHHVYVRAIAHQLNVIGGLNVSAALLLRVSLFYCQCQRALSIEIFLNGLWLLYFSVNGIFLLNSFENSLALNIANQMLLILDVFGSQNTSECFNTILYAFGFFAYIDFFHHYPEWILPGGVLCYLLMFIDKVRAYDASHVGLTCLSIQIISALSLPVLGTYILGIQDDIQVLFAWLGLLIGMSIFETYLYVLKNPQPEPQPVEALTMV